MTQWETVKFRHTEHIFYCILFCFSSNYPQVWRNCDPALPSTWEAILTTSCLSSPTQAQVTCTQQVRPSVFLVMKVKLSLLYLLIFNGHVCLLLPDEFEKYCSDVEHTSAWGGQLEVSSSLTVIYCTIHSEVFCCTFQFILIMYFFNFSNFAASSFDASSSFADRGDPGGLFYHKNWGGIWRWTHHTCVRMFPNMFFAQSTTLSVKMCKWM